MLALALVLLASAFGGAQGPTAVTGIEFSSARIITDPAETRQLRREVANHPDVPTGRRVPPERRNTQIGRAVTEFEQEEIRQRERRPWWVFP